MANLSSSNQSHQYEQGDRLKLRTSKGGAQHHLFGVPPKDAEPGSNREEKSYKPQIRHILPLKNRGAELLLKCQCNERQRETDKWFLKET